MQPFPPVSGVTHSFIKVSNTKLHVAFAGKGKPIVLIHGWPQHWYVWRKVIPELSKNYRLIMPDLPVFGWSEIPKDHDFIKEKLAEDILKLIDTLKLKQVGLIGHDWGGWIGFLACAEQPSKFNKLLTLGIYPPFAVRHLPLQQYYRLWYQLPIAMPFLGKALLRHTSLIDWLIRKGTNKTYSWTVEELQYFSSVLQNSQKAEASSLLYRNFLLKELLPLYKKNYIKKKFQTSTLLLIGENDPVIHPSLFTNFHAEKIQIEYLKACGHFIPEEKPEIVIKRIKEMF